MALESKNKKEFPSQTKNRERWILDTVRANQSLVGWILTAVSEGDIQDANLALDEMHKGDRDALLQPNGILNSAQIEALTGDTNGRND